MNSQIYKTINSKFENKQKLNNLKYTEKINEIYLKIPEIKKIDQRIKKLGIKISKLILFGKSDSKHLSDEINQLRNQKFELLKSHGYNSNHLEVSYECLKCKDTGYIDVNGYSKRCSCFEQELIRQLYKQSNLNLTKTDNFKNFNTNLFSQTEYNIKSGKKVTVQENILNIKRASFKFVENFESQSQKNLFFTGKTGLGKTFMCSCIAYELLNRKKTVLYQSAPSLFNKINEYKFSFNKDKSKYTNILYNNIFNVDLLIIDDIGTEFKSNSRYSDLLNILNERGSNLNNSKKTILSSNLSPKDLYTFYDERIASRIIGEFLIFGFFGTDIRTLKQKNLLKREQAI